MAFWVVGGGGPPDNPGHPAKRTAYHDDYDDYEISKRARLDDYAAQRAPYGPESDSSVRVKNLAFLVIREGTPNPEAHHHHDYLHHRPPPAAHPPPPPPPPRAMTPPPPSAVLFSSAAMERTESGLSISSDTTAAHTDPHEDCFTSRPLLTDLQAANLVRTHVQSSRPDSQAARILRSLIRPRLDTSTPPSPSSSFSSASTPCRRAFPLDDTALRSLFRAANTLFFAHRLSNRVAWDWSHASSSRRYAHHVVGTTALRRSAAPHGGYETLIVLSSPILRDTRYNRRLLIATFLHEMIHSFLFVTCGVKAARGGGHTEGFRIIAETIDEWVGREHLRLADMEADLERFRGGDDDVDVDVGAAGCGGRGGPCGSGGGYATAAAAYAAYPPAFNGSDHDGGTWSRYRRDKHDQGGWEWCEQEGFLTRGPVPASGSFIR